MFLANVQKNVSVFSVGEVREWLNERFRKPPCRKASGVRISPSPPCRTGYNLVMPLQAEVLEKASGPCRRRMSSMLWRAMCAMALPRRRGRAAPEKYTVPTSSSNPTVRRGFSFSGPVQKPSHPRACDRGHHHTLDRAFARFPFYFRRAYGQCRARFLSGTQGGARTRGAEVIPARACACHPRRRREGGRRGEPRPRRLAAAFAGRQSARRCAARLRQ